MQFWKINIIKELIIDQGRLKVLLKYRLKSKNRFVQKNNKFLDNKSG